MPIYKHLKISINIKNAIRYFLMQKKEEDKKNPKKQDLK
jgi:hypothetical protein